MKNITEILSEYGITIPEDKQAGFNKVFAENYKTIVEHEKKVNRLTDDLEAEKKRADTAEETLKGFEGKDFDAITRERDEWKRKHDEAEAAHKQEQEEREFNDLLSAAIAESKGKNAKAITALLDLETLRGSKNQEKDIKAALDSVRTDNGYLFEDNGGKPQFSAAKSGTGNSAQVTSHGEIVKIKDPVERRKAWETYLTSKGE